MKILVTAKRVEDYESKIKVTADGSGIVTEGVKYRINPFDEIGVEEALRLIAKHKGLMCLAVEGRPAGLTIGKHENKMGQRASNTVTLTFDEVRIPVKNRIGAEGEGFKIAM